MTKTNNDNDTLGTEDVRILYEEFMNFYRVLNEGDHSIIKFFNINYGSNIKCVSSDGQGLFFIYNQNKRLWEEASIHLVINYYLEKMTIHFKDNYNIMIELLENNNILVSQKEQLEKLKKEYEKLKKSHLKCSHANSMKSLFLSSFMDVEFIDKLDKAYPHLLPLKERDEHIVLDLKTGKTYPRKREHYFTVELNIDYDIVKRADTTMWDEYFESIIKKEVIEDETKKLIIDYEAIEYLRYYLRYCLSSETKLRSVAIFYGMGKNSKSILMGFIQKLMSKFSQNFDKNSLLDTKHATNDDIYYARRSRIIACDEFNENDILNSAIIKKLTSGDVISSRAVYKSKIEFKPVFKLFLISNHMMTVAADDKAMWDRIVPIHFKTDFTTKNDKDYDEEKIQTGYQALQNDEQLEKLNNNIEGLLKWLLDGEKHYYNTPYYKKPESIMQFLNEYKADNLSTDPFYKWFNNYIDITKNKNDKVEMKELINHYSIMTKNVLKTNAFGKKMTMMKINNIRSSKMIDGKRPIFYIGVKLRSISKDDEEQEKKEIENNKIENKKKSWLEDLDI
jgi:P4 family phage/plasmid primase-like protien